MRDRLCLLRGKLVFRGFGERRRQFCGFHPLSVRCGLSCYLINCCFDWLLSDLRVQCVHFRWLFEHLCLCDVTVGIWRCFAVDWVVWIWERRKRECARLGCG